MEGRESEMGAQQVKEERMGKERKEKTLKR